jgi:hypothetical protein
MKQISCGERSFVLLTHDGKIYSHLYNAEKQVIHVHPVDNYVTMHAARATLVLTTLFTADRITILTSAQRWNFFLGTRVYRAQKFLKKLP